jgi:hypothetical protein
VERPQSISLLCQGPHVLVVILPQCDTELSRKPLQKQVREEDGCLVASRAKLQHRGQQLGRLPSTQWLHPVKSNYPLVVRQLMRIQQALLESRGR